MFDNPQFLQKAGSARNKQQIDLFVIGTYNLSRNSNPNPAEWALTLKAKYADKSFGPFGSGLKDQHLEESTQSDGFSWPVTGLSLTTPKHEEIAKDRYRSNTKCKIRKL